MYISVNSQEAICLDCTNTEHKPPVHVYDKLSVASAKERLVLEGMVTDIKMKLDDCVQTNSDLENALSELQMQHDNAKDLINETFQVIYVNSVVISLKADYYNRLMLPCRVTRPY